MAIRYVLIGKMVVVIRDLGANIEINATFRRITWTDVSSSIRVRYL